MKLCLMILVATAVSGDQVPPGTKLKNLCSTDLARAYVLICYSEADSTQQLVKRNMMPLPALNVLTSSYGPENQGKWMASRSFIPYRTRMDKRMIGGLADECCLKPCFVEEIKSYCP